MVTKWKLWILLIVPIIYSANATENRSEVNFTITNHPHRKCVTNNIINIPEGNDLEFHVNVPDPWREMRCQIQDKIGEFFKEGLFKPGGNKNYIVYSTVLKATKQIEGKWTCYVSLRSLHRENGKDIVCEIIVNIDDQREIIGHKKATYELYYIIGFAVAGIIILLTIIVIIIQALQLKRYRTLIGENPALTKMDSMPKPQKDRNCYSAMPTERRLSKKHERADSSIYHSVGDVSNVEPSPTLSRIVNRPPLPLPGYDTEHIYDEGSQEISPCPPATLPKPTSKKGPPVQAFKSPKTKQMSKLNTEHEQYDYTDTVELVRNQNSMQRPPKNTTATLTLSIREKDWKEREVIVKPKNPVSPGIDSSIMMSELENRFKNKNKPTSTRPAPPLTASKPVLPVSKVSRNQGHGQLPKRSGPDGYQDSMKRQVKVEEVPRQMETRSPPVLRVPPLRPAPPVKPHAPLPMEDTEELYQEVAEDITDNSDDEWCYEALQKFDDK